MSIKLSPLVPVIIDLLIWDKTQAQSLFETTLHDVMDGVVLNRFTLIQAVYGVAIPVIDLVYKVSGLCRVIVPAFTNEIPSVSGLFNTYRGLAEWSSMVLRNISGTSPIAHSRVFPPYTGVFRVCDRKGRDFLIG